MHPARQHTTRAAAAFSAAWILGLLLVLWIVLASASPWSGQPELGLGDADPAVSLSWDEELGEEQPLPRSAFSKGSATECEAAALGSTSLMIPRGRDSSNELFRPPARIGA